MTPINELAAQMREAAEKATPGPWHYCPDEFDDWGFVRATSDGDNGGWLVAVGKPGKSVSQEEKASHRLANTDPYGPNATHIAASNPANVLAILADRDRLEAELAELRMELAVQGNI